MYVVNYSMRRCEKKIPIHFYKKLYLEVINLTEIDLVCFFQRLIDEEQSSMKRSFHLPYTSQGRNQGFNHFAYHRYSSVSSTKTDVYHGTYL